MPSNQIIRTDLFFGQWRYRARFYMPECNALRRLDHEWIDKVINMRRSWGRRSMINYGGSWRVRQDRSEITDHMVTSLHKLCDFLVTDTSARKITICDDQIKFYTNDLGLIERIKKQNLCDFIDVSEVKVQGVRGAINLKSSQHDRRSYLRTKKLETRVCQSLKTWLLAQTDIRLSPSLAHWCGEDRQRVYDYYFLDHSSDSITNMLQIITPGLIRCTMPIVTDK
jgi:hypothetical protein